MARIIPELSSNEINHITSRAEQRFYIACRDELDDEYLVIHSIPFVVKLSGAPREGEADFVIFSPDRGFIVIEIKGGGVFFEAIKRKWYSIDFSGTQHFIKDPFLQGSKESHAINKLLKNHKDWPKIRLPRVVFGHSAFFPDLDRIDELVMPHGPREIIGGRVDLKKLYQWIPKVFDYWNGERKNSHPLGQEGMRIIEDLFCRNRKVQPLISVQIESEEVQRIELTYQQSLYLRALGKRRRAAISGGAGTGKTLLAMEKAKELARTGNKTLFLCYNLPLSEHLKEVAGQKKNLYPMNFHQLCKWRIDKVISEHNIDLEDEAKLEYPNENLFHVQLPYALARSTELIFDSFDAIIIDEGQDFREDYWLPIEMLLKDAENSYLYIFFDPNQALYQQVSTFPIKEEPLPLTINCRNTKHIHEIAYHYYIGDPVDPPSIDGVPVEFICAQSYQDRLHNLHKFVGSLITTQKVEPEQITILVGGQSKNAYYESIRPLTLPNGIKYSIELHRASRTVLVESVGRFKGLESDIIILWGIDEFNPERDKEMLYVAFSRAKSRLYIVGTEEGCRNALNWTLANNTLTG